ncbi:MAG: hypothetical protein ACU85E_18160 [Gammaproteobacteria bacterium]
MLGPIDLLIEKAYQAADAKVREIEEKHRKRQHKEITQKIQDAKTNVLYFSKAKTK